MSDTENDLHEELPQIWQFIHPLYNKPDEEEEEEDAHAEGEDTHAAAAAAAADQDEGHARDAAHKHTRHTKKRAARPADYVKLSRRAPRLGKLFRYLAEIEDEEELQHTILGKDPVTGQTLLQWAALQNHFMLVEYLIKRLKRGAFAFDADSPEMAIFTRWEEMKAELPSTAEVLERQRSKERARAERRAQREAQQQANREAGNNNNNNDDDDDEMDEDEDEEDEPEAMPEELVYESLSEFHDEWGSRGLGLVKRVGELGFYTGARRRDGTKHGLGASLYANGDCYCGLYCNNQREGTGVYWWSQQGTTHYVGQWAQNMRHGMGRMVYADGSRYLGQWRANKKHGQGRYTYADGSSYDGMWDEDEKHGPGMYTFTDGSVHEGSFVHNAFVAGTWSMANGTVKYIGNFDPLHERPIGAGVFVHQLLRLDESNTAQQVRMQGRMQREGCWRGSFPDEKWIPAAVKGTTSTHVTPYFEMIVPHAPTRRIPLSFAASCVGYETAQLVHVANFAPLQDWLREIDAQCRTCFTQEAKSGEENYHSKSNAGGKKEAMCGVRVSKIEIERMSYYEEEEEEEEGGEEEAKGTTARLRELSIRPLLVDESGRRLELRTLRNALASHESQHAQKTNSAKEGTQKEDGGEEEGEEEDGIVTLTAPTARLFVLLLPSSESQRTQTFSSSSSGLTPMVLLEQTLRFNSPDVDHMQCRLPTISLTSTSSHTHHSNATMNKKLVMTGGAGEEVYGAVSERVGPALRLELHTTRHMLSLLHDPPAFRAANTKEVVCGAKKEKEKEEEDEEECARKSEAIAVDPAHGSNARTSVWLYAQELHPDAFALLGSKLQSLSLEEEKEQGGQGRSNKYATRYLAVPLHEVVQKSSDAVTVLAACEVLRRRAAHELPLCTIEPQRPPTPLPPAPQPRPALQPLYDARAARHALEQQDQEEE